MVARKEEVVEQELQVDRAYSEKERLPRDTGPAEKNRVDV
jgi:hypothetical protein